MEKRFSVIVKCENVRIRLQFNDFNDAVDFYELSSKRPTLREVYIVSNYTGEILRITTITSSSSGKTLEDTKSNAYLELEAVFNC